MKNPFKKEEIQKEPLENINVSDIKSPISEPILSYLEMKTVGALFLTGNWGSGKTYHIKKYIFPLVKAQTSYTPIIVSLYGETSKHNIIQKILFAFFNSKDKNSRLGTGTIAKNLKNLLNALPFINKFFDLEKLIIGSGENILKLLPLDKLFICFDDIERMSEHLNVDDFLGIINELVESNQGKVLLIANESKIKNGITFKEKTIEKTIHFIPSLPEIFDNVIESYSDSDFKTFLKKNKEFFVLTLTSNTQDDNLNKELDKSFSNIRTLKFALEHFKVAFELLNTSEEIDELLNKQIKNLWIFVLSISIEFRKPNNISFGERKELDNQVSTPFDIDPSTFEQLLLNGISENESNVSYSKNFKNIYYNRLSEQYIYYEDLYNLITSGKNINSDAFKNNIDKHFNVKEGKVNPANTALNSLMQGYWMHTDESFVKTLNDLLDYCEKGCFNDILSYLNSAVYILGFNEITGVDKDTIVSKIKIGIDITLPKVNFNHFTNSQFDMVKGQFSGEHLELLIQHVEQKTEELELLKEEEEIKLIQSLFKSDLSAFVKRYLPERYDIRTPDKPLFHKMGVTSIKMGLQNAQPEGIMSLSNLLKVRYESFSEYLIEEIKFLNELEEGVSEIDFSKKTLSNHLIKNELSPKIMKCKNILQESINRKANG